MSENQVQAASSPAVKKVAAKKPRAAGSSKPKANPNHPTYAAMIAAAITKLAERGGSSRYAIVKYIQANYQVDAKTVNQHVKVALRSGVKSGSFKQAKGTGAAGSFRLGEKKAAKPKVKKVKAPKKPAVKKPKAAKKAGSAKPRKPAAKKAAAPAAAAASAPAAAPSAAPKKATTKAAAKSKTKAAAPAKKPAAAKAKKASPLQAKKAKVAAKAKPAAKKAAAKPKAAAAKKPAAKKAAPAKSN